MIEARHFPRNVNDLKAVIKDATVGATRIVAQAGHFLLYYDSVEDQVLPCISSELTSPRHELLRREVGEFPHLSWRTALEVLGGLPASEKAVMVVVNDWQYLPEGVDRNRFYGRYRRLPEQYQDTLIAQSGGLAHLPSPPTFATYPFFGEKLLRNRYHREVKRLMRSGALPADATIESGEDVTVCSLPDVLGRRLEIYCSSTTGDCAAEVSMMIREARDLSGCDTFIDFYPIVCKHFVERGTELADRLFGTGVETVLNIGLQARGVQSEADMLVGAEVCVHRFSGGEHTNG